ncbi:hypothetical protein H5410_013285 [Solanum commersonii]|uniref:Uncharacterized protein n=1 Tax=Solanum commersonii TaxID=4109 RepID=A0A9J6AUX3_SOLCO|nr:hypothetical protein H5410_013285 [Solanum commersonii]
MHGLGYDVVSDDFKVVALSEGKSVTCVYMYSVRKGLWEKLENSPYDHSLSDHASGVLVNGALHWFDLGIPSYGELIIQIASPYEVTLPFHQSKSK